MAIDRVGKGALPPVPETGGPARPDETRAPAPFTVDRGAPPSPATEAQKLEGLDPASPLGRLRAGEVDVHGYVDLKVEEATKSLKGLTAAELDEIKRVLRDQLRTDPALADLVRTATGEMPSPPSSR